MIKLAFEMVWLMEILPLRTSSDKFLKDKGFNIVRKPK